MLSAVDPAGPPFSGWLGYAVIGLIGAGLIGGTWGWVAAADRPRGLAFALGLALGLRLLVGWGLEVGLPIWGYDEPVQRAGYVFYDASKRDGDAWALAASEKPLSAAFSPRYTSDQYGGLLFLSAGVYRAVGQHVHRPLMIAALAAVFGALAVVFTWAFAGMTFGARAGMLAAWIVALYPEAVLLGASQMREPFMMTGLAVTFYGLARARLGERRRSLIPLIAGPILCLAVSPPFGALCVVLLAGAWVWESTGVLRRPWVIGLLLVLAGLGAVLTIRAWGHIGGLPGKGILDVVAGWITAGAEYQLRIAQQQSAVIQFVFKSAPKWAYLPLATLYGLTQPFLPAALMDPGAAVWRVIAIFRGLGWYALLPFLAYAFVAAFGERRWRHPAVYLALVSLLVIVVASFRAAGDQWDNPRYRAAFICLQAALAGWAWVNAQRTGSPWLKRLAGLVAGLVVLFLPWYAGRTLGIPSPSLYATLGLELAFSVVYMGAAVVLDRRRRVPPGPDQAA